EIAHRQVADVLSARLERADLAGDLEDFGADQAARERRDTALRGWSGLGTQCRLGGMRRRLRHRAPLCHETHFGWSVSRISACSAASHEVSRLPPKTTSVRTPSSVVATPPASSTHG